MATITADLHNGSSWFCQPSCQVHVQNHHMVTHMWHHILPQNASSIRLKQNHCHIVKPQMESTNPPRIAKFHCWGGPACELLAPVLSFFHHQHFPKLAAPVSHHPNDLHPASCILCILEARSWSHQTIRYLNPPGEMGGFTRVFVVLNKFVAKRLRIWMVILFHIIFAMMLKAPLPRKKLKTLDKLRPSFYDWKSRPHLLQKRETPTSKAFRIWFRTRCTCAMKGQLITLASRWTRFRDYNLTAVFLRNHPWKWSLKKEKLLPAFFLYLMKSYPPKRSVPKIPFETKKSTARHSPFQILLMVQNSCTSWGW